MTIFKIENFFLNSSFLTLFLSMFFYWIQAGFKLKIEKWCTLTISIANVSLFILLVLRWKESGHFPLSNLYESLIFLSWCFTLINLILEKETNLKLLGCILSPSALFTNAFATFSLPAGMQDSSPLVPALQSNWLMMHVTVMILSYAALICGSLLSIAFLIVTKNSSFENNSELSVNNTINVISDEITLPIASLQEAIPNLSKTTNTLNWKSEKKEKLAQSLDNLSYRILGLGFPFLTIGILSGAVWANEAWGSYWSWDPKETWALLTWLVFAIYLHTRLTKGWTGKKPAIIASLGFITVWICFLGVNLIGEGLHSYGWIQS